MADDNDDLVSPFGPIANPVDRFGHLPEPTRKWLEGLREEDLNELTEIRQLMHRAKIIGRFGKWIVATMLAALLGGVAIGEAIAKILNWLTQWVRP